MKKFKLFISLCLFMVMLTGCVKVQADFNVDRKGKVTGQLKYLVSEEMLAYTSTTKETMINNLKKELNSKNVTEIEEKIDNKTYYGIKAKADDINYLKATVKNGKVTFTLPVKRLLNNSTKGSDYSLYKSYLSTAKSAGASAIINVTMPNKPKTNVGTIKDNTVTIDIFDLAVNNKNLENIIITSSSTAPYIKYLVALGVVVLTAIGLFFYFKKKKSLEASK